jgi:uncharacterized pyridoxal phosphate-containing UPF0001 family protein
LVLLKRLEDVMSRSDVVVTIAEIETTFQSEWVLIGDPQTNKASEVERGNVRFHSKDRDGV